MTLGPPAMTGAADLAIVGGGLLGGRRRCGALCWAAEDQAQRVRISANPMKLLRAECIGRAGTELGDAGGRQGPGSRR